ncbi:unnamed protein product [Effrenium voratum]|uniref:Uncharacterized protein n=1 Tax=Effrenium voratum TaxID=2562239 RepID=A0AA36NEZ3_9DINO|nr:unnamed protein product [Effrenium voratum]
MASTFERLFGSEGPAASNGASPQTGAQGRKSGSPDGQATGILPSQDEKFLGSGKRRLKEPGSGCAREALSPKSQAWSGSPRSLGGSLESEDLKSSCGPVRRRFPSADKISVPLPPWAAPGELSPCVPPARDRSPRAQDRRVADWTHGYDLDAYRSIRVYPDSSHYKTCAALSKAYFEPQEHADLLGPDGMPRGACKRQGSPDARGTQSSITFTASGTSPEAVREPSTRRGAVGWQGLHSFLVGSRYGASLGQRVQVETQHGWMDGWDGWMKCWMDGCMKVNGWWMDGCGRAARRQEWLAEGCRKAKPRRAPLRATYHG